METTMVAPRARVRQPVSALGKLTIAALVVIAIDMVYLQVALIGMLIPPLAVFVALALIFAGVVALGFRWAPSLGVLLSVAMLALNGVPIFHAVSAPSTSFPMFVLGITMLPAMIVGIIAGIAAIVQNYRHAPEARRTPRGLSYVVTALLAVIGGALLVAAMPATGTAAGIDPATLNGLPIVATKNFEFEQKEIRAKVGETVALKLTNSDAEAHFLDIDELNIHAPMPAGKESLALFKPTQPGTYTFYCSPHYDKASGEGMKGRLIVE